MFAFLHKLFTHIGVYAAILSKYAIKARCQKGYRLKFCCLLLKSVGINRGE